MSPKFSVGEVAHLLMVVPLEDVPNDGTRANVEAWRERVAARRIAVEACGIPCDDDLAIKSLVPSDRIVAAYKADRRFDVVSAILAGNEPMRLERTAR